MEDSELERKIIDSLREGYNEQEIQTALQDDGYSSDRITKLISEAEERLENPENTTDNTSSPAQPQETPGREETSSIPEKSSSDSSIRPGKKRGPAKVIILTFVTFGFYVLYWEYQAFKQVLHGTESSPVTWYLGSWVPLLNIVIYWKICGRLEEYSNGEYSRILLILAWIAFFPAGMYFTQKALNEGLAM